MNCIFTGVPHSINGTFSENQGHMLVKKRALEARCLPGRAGLAVQDRVLPDEDTITSRCLTGAWEQNIDVVNIDVVPLLKNALQVSLVVFSIVTWFSSYKLSTDVNLPLVFESNLTNYFQMYMQKILTECTKVCKAYHMDEHNIPFGFNQPHPAESICHLPSLIVLSKRYL